jgi:hypothetical protein
LFEELLLDDCADGGELLDLELLELALECELSDLDKEDEEQEKLGFLLEELLDDLVEWEEWEGDEDELLEEAEL